MSDGRSTDGRIKKGKLAGAFDCFTDMESNNGRHGDTEEVRQLRLTVVSLQGVGISLLGESSSVEEADE